MEYKTNEIWRNGFFSTHQKLLATAGRLGIEVVGKGKDRAISQADYIKLLQSRHRTIRTDTGRQEIERRLQQLGNNSSTPSPMVIKATPVVKESNRTKPRPSKTPSPKLWHHRWSYQAIELMATVANFFAQKPVIFFALVAALSIQVRHLAALAQRVGGDDGILISYAFAVVSEVTALLLVIHGSTKNMLLLFAVFQCTINLLYYIDLPLVITKITLSVLITVVVYSYSHLYAKGIDTS